MIVNPSLVTAARRNGDKRLSQTCLIGKCFTQASEVVDLLTQATSPAAQTGARHLLREMSAAHWYVIRGLHRSGDDTPHMLVEVRGVRYHLRVDFRQCIFDITCKDGERTHRPSGRMPHTPPGA
jgi:hypothetical protein